MTQAQRVIKYVALGLAFLLIAGIFSGIMSILLSIFDTPVLDKGITHEINGDVSDLDIDIGAAKFKVNYADSFSVESNLKHLTVKVRNGELQIIEKQKRGNAYKDAYLTLSVPKDFTFGEVELETGAGDFTIDALFAKRLSLSLGAGKVTINDLRITERAEVEGGAGELAIMGGSIRDLSLEMGVGDAEITAAMLGNCDIEFGIGDARLDLIGSEDDYTLEVSRGIGNVEIDGTKVSGNSRVGNGTSRLDIECGIGNVVISFVKE